MNNYVDTIKMLKAANINPNDSTWKINRKMREVGFCGRVEDGASKVCLMPDKKGYVIKFTYVETDTADEAMQEVNIYRKAKEAGLEKFFPKTAFLITINGINFVVQERIDSSVFKMDMTLRRRIDRIGKTPTEHMVEKMEKAMHKNNRNKARNLSREWAKAALSLYGKRTCKALCEFISENRINDLHSANLGFLNSRPVILDFSGYHRDDW